MNLREKQVIDNFLKKRLMRSYNKNPPSSSMQVTSSMSSSPGPGPIPPCSKHSTGSILF